MNGSQKNTLSKVFVTLRYLKKLVWLNQKKWLVKLCSVTLIMGFVIALNVGVPLLFKQIMNHLSLQHREGMWINSLLFAYGIAWSVRHVSSQIRSYLVTNVLEEIINSFGLALFDHLHTLSMKFHLERKTGAVSSAITRSYHGIEALLWGLVLFMIPTILEIFIAIGIISYLYGLAYGSAIALILILYSAASIIGLELTQKLHETHNEKRAKTKSFMIDSLLNFETVKYFSNQQFEHDECKKIVDSQMMAAHAVNTRMIHMQLVQSLILGSGLAFITWFVGGQVLKGHIQVSDFVLINSYMLQFIMPLSHFGHILQQVRKGFVDIGDSINLLELKPEVVDSVNAFDIKTEQATITFDQVCFSYDEKREILHNITFSIQEGKKVALVGPTGSGKSTIGRLLFRLYDVKKGAIKINGHDIRFLTQSSLHALIGIVSQDTVLFNNTLYYNIAYGNTSASREAVLEAAHYAHLEHYISQLPLGLETPVGERGLLISGGEKQRIAIARAFLKKPAVFVFDEATSALDTRIEKNIQHKIKELSSAKTTLVIAHRLSTVIDADEILVMDKGRIVERGTHQQLLLDSALYADLWYEQAQISKLPHENKKTTNLHTI